MNPLPFDIPTSSIWLAFGVFLIIFEVFFIPGIGLVFAGLGAVTVGGVLLTGWIDATSSQFILFFLSTGVWAICLWKPLKKFIEVKDSGFDDMVGSTAIVYGVALQKGKTGEVKWSGTIMKCELQSEGESDQIIEAGAEVVIREVCKGILIVQEKPPK
jgi:membrane protein implicated in regulation of membrane protease activity